MDIYFDHMQLQKPDFSLSVNHGLAPNRLKLATLYELTTLTTDYGGTKPIMSPSNEN